MCRVCTVAGGVDHTSSSKKQTMGFIGSDRPRLVGCGMGTWAAALPLCLLGRSNAMIVLPSTPVSSLHW